MRVSDGVERGLEHAELAVRAASRAGRRRASLPRARRVRPAPLQRRAGHTARGDGRGARARAVARRVAALGAGRREHPRPPARGGRASSTRAGRFSTSSTTPRGRGTTPVARRSALWHLGLLEWRAGNWDEADRYAAGSELFDAARPRRAARRVPGRGHRRPPGPDRRGARQGASARRPGRVRGDPRSRVGLQLGPRLHRALARRRRGGAPAPETRVRAPRRLHARAGDAARAWRPARGARRHRRARRGGRDPRRRGSRERPRSTGPGRSRSSLAAAGSLLAARGDLEGAFASFERALAEHARDADPFHHARTLLALGRTQRRAKKRGAARTTLEDALARFETLGAPLWAEQTRAELARIGGRAPSRGELTEAERRIAALVAEGRTNRRGRGRPLPHRALRRDGAHADLPQARRPLARGARAPLLAKT